MLLCSAVGFDLKSGGCLWPALRFCPLAIRGQELPAQLWAPFNEIDRHVKLLCSMLRGREGPREATAGISVHKHARSFRKARHVGELTSPHKGTLFNLLHIKAQAPQSRQAQTAVDASQSLPF